MDLTAERATATAIGGRPRRCEMTTELSTMLPSPLGELRLVADGEGLRGVYFPVHRHDPELAGVPILELEDAADADPGAHAILRAAATQLGEYFAGQRRGFDLPLRPTGTAFQQRVWLQLREIPFAVTRSYGELATAVGNRNASRAVGAANGKNPISIIVPCHRVIGADGSLTGFGGGEPAKRWLLDHEARVAGLRLL
jgi:methylated-DNA-[protein]-cysteine S-methyltransferase